MKRFVFRLDGVLRIRAFELEQARVRLAELLVEQRARRARVEEAAARLERGRALLADEAREGVDGERLALRADGVTAGRMLLGRAHRALAELDPALAAAREAVRSARTRVRSLERLRERRIEVHRREGEAHEQAELEETVRSRRARRQAHASRPWEGSPR